MVHVPGATAVFVAVRVTDAPTMLGFALDVTTVVVGSGLVVWVIVGLVATA